MSEELTWVKALQEHKQKMAELQAENAQQVLAITALERIRDALQAENERLKEALQRYGHHDSPCLALEDDECICGFKQALQEKPK